MPEVILGKDAYFFREIGTGTLPVHFIHCSLASGKSWVPLAEVFSDQARMTAIDLPGHGRSAPAPKDGDLHGRATQASIALLEQAKEPLHLVGHSFGATVALRIAVERPALVKSLVLFEPVLFSVLIDVAPEAFAQEVRDNAEFAGFLSSGDQMAAAAHFLSRWGLPGEWQKMPQKQKEIMASRIDLIRLTSSVLHGSVCGSLHLDRLRAVSAPAIVVHGAESPNVMAHVTRTLAEAIPDAKLFTIKGAGHMVPLTHVEQVSAVMRDFWEGDLDV